ncbi:adenylate kinase [Mycena sanguinolenta]|uniref:Adenylate kinase n=1 Tax=Mycena sanguinolenta TaxID=230812 RepID=A0A8H6YJP1_9AGAR|nr:adenylate kinase [Mycena sanguinolenta]
MPSRKSAATPLQRGSACLCCRKRKLKCDGTRPVCAQCIKMNRDEECEYDDKKQKSRTQKLKEKLSVLEQRLRELESESAATSPASSDPSSLPATQHSSPELAALPSLFAGGSGNFDNLFDNSSWSNSSASSSLRGGASGYGTPELDPSRMWDSDDSDPNTHPFLELSPFSSLPSTSEFPYMPRWNPQEPLPYEIKKILLDIFLAHRHQCWFDGQVERFSLSSTEPFGFEPHPALMNAIYLLACHFARSPYCSEIEPIFFTRALHEITVALDNADRLVDIVQASCLLSVYLYVNCRSLEGYTHSFSAARLAVGLGLHQIRPLPPLGTDPSQLYSDEITPIPIPPARDRAEMADRIAAFWQVFMVDRCWSVVSGLPVALPDGDCPQVRIKTPWPTPEENDVPLLGEPSTNTVSTLFEHQPMLNLGPDAIFMPALRAKAAALYERTYRLASSAKKSETYWADHQSAGLALQRFGLNLPAFVGYEAWRTQAPLIDVDLFAVHTMVHVSTLHLYKDTFSPEIFHGANSILSLLIRQLNDVDYEYLDPVLSACWSTAARTYVRMMAFAGQQIDTTTVYSMPIIEQELEIILNAMKTLSAFFPAAGEQARKINQEAAQARTNVIL